MIKPWKVGAAVFCILLCFFAWIIPAQAPIEMVEMELYGFVGQETLAWIQSEYTGIMPSVHIEKETSDYRLVMSSGNDRFFHKDGPGLGRWLMESDRNAIVLGEELVDQYFHRHDIIGEEMNFRGDTYEVVGIESNSQTIMIPFDEEREKEIDWDRKTLLYRIPNESFEEAFISRLRQEFRRFDISVLYVVNHRHWRWSFMNLALLIAAVFVGHKLYNVVKIMGKESREFVRNYRQTHRLKTLVQYIKENRRSFMQILLKLGIVFIYSGLVYFMVSLIAVPMSLRPSNFFSLLAYRELLTEGVKQISLNFRHGFSDFQIDVMGMWCIGILVFFLAQIVLIRRGRRHG